jgi:ligand-binding sensor domain-containing protein
MDRFPPVPLIGRNALVLFAVLCGMVGGAFGQQYPFLPVPGAPKNVKTLFQDSRGRLWVGGDQLACYDGARLFFLADYGFPATASYSIAEDASGAIWIGADTGVYRFANGRVEEIGKGVAVSVTPAAPGLVVAAIGPLGKGLPTNASLVRFERVGSAWKTETVMSLDSPGPMTLDHAGQLLYVWPAKGWNELRLEDVVRWHPGTQLHVRRHPLPADKLLNSGPFKVLRDRFGCVWVGANGQQAYDCGDNRWPIAQFEGADIVANLSESADGSMVLPGFDMLAVGRPGSFRVARLNNGLPTLNAAIEAQDGTIWLGATQGLYRFASPFRMEYWTARDGVDTAWCVQRSGANVYAGLGRKVGVLSKDRQRWQSVASFASIGQVVNLLSLHDGTLLAGVSPGGAALLRPDGKVLARTASPYPGSTGDRLAQLPNQEIWIGGTFLGHLRRDGARLNFENHPLKTLPSRNVNAIRYEELTRKLWVCYEGGLTVRSEDGSWSEITTKDGLLVNNCGSLAALPNGDVWIGYAVTPVFARVHPTAQGRYTVTQFRPGGEIRDAESLAFFSDRRGWLWRGGYRGLSVADPSDAGAGRWLFLDQVDGLSGEGINQGSNFTDSDGSIWFGSDISIFHYSPPSDLVTPKFAPQVFLSALSWNGATPKIAEAVAGLPYGSKAVAHFGSLQFDRRNALRLRYRILPEQSLWQESTSLDLPLGSLSWGSHTLEVQGRVFTGPWSGTVRQRLTVLRPFWLAWPALAGLTLAGSAAASLAFGWRKRRARRARASLPDLAALRLEALAPEVHNVLGTVLDGRYEVGEILARGGFATVLSGRDVQQGGARCAVKIFRPELKDDEWMAHRFQQEVAALEQIHHPNVVRIYGHGATPGGAPYLVMEFVDGQTLRDAMQGARMAAPRIASLLRQAGSALDGIHAHGIYHRDLKPENIMLRSAGPPEHELVIIDFSIAIVQDPDKSVQGISRAAGSIIYMAPENAVGYADSSTDIHSLAKILIELLTGQRLVELLPQASIDLPARVREVLTGRVLGLSDASLELICAATEFHPSGRPKSASQFADRIAKDLDAANLPSDPSASPGPFSSDNGPA